MELWKKIDYLPYIVSVRCIDFAVHAGSIWECGQDSKLKKYWILIYQSQDLRLFRLCALRCNKEYGQESA